MRVKKLMTMLSVIALVVGATSAFAVPNVLLIENVTPWDGSGFSNAQTLTDIADNWT